MGPKDEASAKPAEIGNALVEALGFEPAEGTKLGRSTVAEVSEPEVDPISKKISEAGFAAGEMAGKDSSNGHDTTSDDPDPDSGTDSTVDATADANGDGDGEKPTGKESGDTTSADDNGGADKTAAVTQSDDDSNDAVDTTATDAGSDGGESADKSGDAATGGSSNGVAQGLVAEMESSERPPSSNGQSTDATSVGDSPVDGKDSAGAETSSDTDTSDNNNGDDAEIAANQTRKVSSPPAGRSQHNRNRSRSKKKRRKKSNRSGTRVGDSTDGASTSTNGKLKNIPDGDPNETLSIPGPPDSSVVVGSVDGARQRETDDLVESLVTAGTMVGNVAPTAPPMTDRDVNAAASGSNQGQPAAVGSGAIVPSGPAITGEHPVVEVEARPVEARPVETQIQPRAETQPVRRPRPQIVLPDVRSVIDRPRSISDMFSGGITGRRRLQARKVRRVVRHIDPWSVLTFSVLFHLCLFAALLLASVLVWNVADEAGTIENVESFIRELGDYETFEINGEAIFRAAVAIAGIMTLAASVLVVLLTVVFNLLSDLLGGVRITVIEEETLRVKPSDDPTDGPPAS